MVYPCPQCHTGNNLHLEVHQLLAVQPTLQPGQDIPHVPAPTDETGVPPGEGCYQCDIEDKDIPLSKRAKRSTQVN
jgi:hypothetical protein